MYDLIIAPFDITFPGAMFAVTIDDQVKILSFEDII